MLQSLTASDIYSQCRMISIRVVSVLYSGVSFGYLERLKMEVQFPKKEKKTHSGFKPTAFL